MWPIGTVLAEESIDPNYFQNLGKGAKKEQTPTKSSSICAHSSPNHALTSTITIQSFIGGEKAATQKSLSVLCAYESKKSHHQMLLLPITTDPVLKVTHFILISSLVPGDSLYVFLLFILASQRECRLGECCNI